MFCTASLMLAPPCVQLIVALVGCYYGRFPLKMFLKKLAHIGHKFVLYNFACFKK